MNLPVGAAIGFFLGFAFGVGCALAVMYSIYMGGYRAAVTESLGDPQPKRWVDALTSLKIAKDHKSHAETKHPPD